MDVFSMSTRKFAIVGLFVILKVLPLILGVPSMADDRVEGRVRARDLGLEPGVFTPGPHNAITDVKGVRVGHLTIHEPGESHTGVTAILPHPGNLFQEKVAAGVFVGNAFGKLAGSTQIEELGTIESPIILTNTLSVGPAVEAVVRYTLRQPGNGSVVSVNAVVGETNDAGLNNIRALPIRVEHVIQAIENAREGPVAEGTVGAGTGTQCFGWKGGIGTSSRVLPDRYGGYTLGVLVQSNFGGVLNIDGAPVGKRLGRHSFVSPPDDPSKGANKSAKSKEDGSCMIVVATDAPVDARELRRIAARAIYGMARTGASFSSSSGDYAIAFSTAPTMRTRHGSQRQGARDPLSSDAVSPLFQATLEATEEAILNSLLQATTVEHRGHTAQAIPIDQVKGILSGGRDLPR